MNTNPASLSHEFLGMFSRQWLAAWNEHDLDRILELYEDDFEFTSPVLANLLPHTGGKVQGKAAIRPYSLFR